MNRVAHEPLVQETGVPIRLGPVGPLRVAVATDRASDRRNI